MDLFERIKEATIWSDIQSYKRGDFLCRDGQIDTHIYWVRQGLFRIYQVDDDQEYGVRFGYEGDLISVLDAYIKHEPTRYNVQALRQSKVQFCTKMDFENLLQADPELQNLWMKGLYQLVCDMMEREQDLMIAEPQKRLQRVLERSPRLFQEVPHKYIASYLRMSPETLSRLMNS